MTKGESRGRWVISLAALALSTSCAEPTTFTPLAPSVPQLRLPRNDAYQGSVLTGSLRPVFTWEASVTNTSDPITYELQISTDRTFTTDVTAVTVDEPRYQPPTNLLVSTVPPVGNRYFWRVQACLPLICSDYSPTWWVNLGRSAKDFNGDGYADVVVGAPKYESRGAAFLFFGGPGPTLDTTADGVFDDSVASDDFGRFVADSFDFNGDGFADVAVSSLKRTWLYFGGPGRCDETADVTFPDLVSGDALRFLSSGDMNADGFSDLAIGNPSDGEVRPGAGKVLIYYGGTYGQRIKADGVLTGEAQFQAFGYYGDLGDLNGDGLADIVVSSNSFDDDFKPACFVDVFFGHSGLSLQAPEQFHLRANTADYCTSQAVIPGDLDGDGFNDLAMGIKNGSDAEQIEFFRGGEQLSEVAFAKMDTVKENFVYLYAIATIGDVNGDGHADISILDNFNPAKNSVYFGRSLQRGGGVEVPSAATLLSGRTASAGDVNGDGYDDVLVGAETLNRAVIYFGGPGDSFDVSTTWTLQGTGNFGRGIARTSGR